MISKDALLRGLWWLLPLALAGVVAVLPTLGLEFSVTRQIQLALILALIVSGLNISLGYAGELAVGQAAMYAGGAYTAGLLSVAGHTDLLVHLLAAASVALVIGLVTGIPGLRLGSWSLAMTSFFLVLLLPDVLAILEERTGGRNGLSGILSPTLAGHLLTPDEFYLAIVVVTVVWFAVMRNIVVSRHGIALRVLKKSPVLAASMGISVFRMKLLAYALGAIPAGLAGALFANLDLYISPDSFDFTLATTVLAASILGGSTSVYGAVVGAAILQFGLNQSGDFERYSLVVTGTFLVIGGVLLTGGLSGLAKGVLRRVVPSTTPAVEVSDVRALPVHGRTLVADGVSKSFGGNRALSSVSLTAEPGRITALIGPNGSGKTTLLNMVSGFYRTDQGSIRIDARRLHRSGPDRVARAGVARTFQTPNIPEGVTVLETVISGRYTGHRVTVLETVLRLPRYRRVRREDLAEAERVLGLVGLAALRDAEATSLPLGQRRLLEVARCLVADPGVLLLDEVASGLDEDEIDRLADLLRRVRDAGGTIVLVEHNFQLVLALADDVYVLTHGELMTRGTPEQIERDPRVMREYLGVTAEDESETRVIADLADPTVGGAS